MPAPAAPGADWKRAREDFEAGAKSRRELAAELGVTPQAVDKRARHEGWVKPRHRVLKDVSKRWIERAEELGIDEDGTAKSCTRHAAAVLADAISRGLPQSLAAPLAGIAKETFIRWRDDDPKLKQLVEEAEAAFAEARIGNVNDAAERGDSQAARWMLERHAATREHFRSADAAGGGIVINVTVGAISDGKNLANSGAGPIIDVTPDGVSDGAQLRIPAPDQGAE